MKKVLFELVSSLQIAEDIYELVLKGDCSGIRCGQFVNIELDGFYLRRPISVCDVNNNRLTLVCKAVGQGTAALCSAPVGTKFDVLTGLGNGYDLDECGKKPVLAGGGVGTPPMYLLAKKLIAKGIAPYVALGFANEAGAFYIENFKALGCQVAVATVDGSMGCKGFITDAMKDFKHEMGYIHDFLQESFHLLLGNGNRKIQFFISQDGFYPHFRFCIRGKNQFFAFSDFPNRQKAA